ncbi:MAG: ABC transporter substrate-binding protein [Candidatus Hodarchaeota archaeon]
MNFSYSRFFLILAFSIILLPRAELSDTLQLASSQAISSTGRRSEQPLQTFFFNISLLCPDNSYKRIQYVEWIAEELPKIGIGINITDIADWDSVDARSYEYYKHPVTNRYVHSDTPPYDEGGYDVVFAGNVWWNIHPLGRAYYYGYSTNPIDNTNFGWYQNATVEQLFAALRSEVDEGKQRDILKQCQIFLYEDLPDINIVYTNDPFWLTAENWTIPEEEWLAIEAKRMQSGWASFGFNNISPIIISGPWMAFPDPPFRDYDWGERANTLHRNMVWQGLFERDPFNDFKWKPLIAKSMPVWGNNNRTATVELRQDVSFADGTNATAHDVVESFRRQITPAFGMVNYDVWTGEPIIAPNGSTVKVMPYFESNESIEALDNYTVQFTWTAPCPNAFDIMDTPIMPLHIWGNHTHPKVQQLGNDTFETACWEAIIHDPVTFAFGTGPFRFMEWNQDSPFVRYNATLKAVADYWKGPVATDEIVFVELERDQAIDALQNGSVHFLCGTQPGYGFQASEVKDVEGITLHSGHSWTQQHMTINMNHPILGTGEATPLGQDDPSRAAKAARYVRQAISHVIPRQRIADELYGSYASPGVGGSALLPISIGFDESIEPHAYNLTKAEALLAKAGYEKPEPPANTTTPTTSVAPTFASSSSEDANFPFVSYLTGLAILAVATMAVRKRRQKICLTK